ncbi:transcriptional regulator [Paenibacillus sp. FSL H8-0548]|uniref:LysR family transcriptional regulator n=1 Tax=Paenibacillus sp. FSL H8-0548 TaxID=1920422 RepID=UPI00096CA231|nr:LysR family transcriptional regulator [Paenibacillus sp. FSL H8-0548]OMF37596.1 transcriptional regulator [Paenibacillus sp. FSL H8-0548]
MRTIERLSTFIVLAECGTFTEAAKRLYCSQPTISHHIQQLEEQFKVILFYRTGKKVELTKQGIILLDYAKQVNQLMDMASYNLQNSVQQEEQILPVYVSNFIALYYFPELMVHFRNEFPKQQMEVYSFCYDELKRSLLEGRTNWAIMPLYPEDDYIHSEFDISVIIEDDFKLVFPSDHQWVDRKVLYARDLNGQTILLPQSMYISKYIVEQLAQQHITVRYLQMSNFEVIKQAVKSGIGISILPYAAVRAEVEEGGLAVKWVSSLQINRQNGFVVRKNAKLTEYEMVFKRALEGYFNLRLGAH